MKTSSSGHTADAVPAHPTIERLFRFATAGTVITNRILEILAWPYVELVIRWWLANVFFFRGLRGLMDFQDALAAARIEYAGHFMSSVAATYAGAWIELVGAVLLA